MGVPFILNEPFIFYSSKINLHSSTETIRSATPESVQFVNAMVNPESTIEHRLGTLDSAVNRHGELTKDAAMGKGVDRHLFSMKYLAQKEGLPLPDFYSDPVYMRMCHSTLSTSTLTHKLLVLGGFAPVVSDGYGIGYAVNDNRIGVGISGYQNETKVFLDHVHQSCRDIRDLLESK